MKTDRTLLDIYIQVSKETGHTVQEVEEIVQHSWKEVADSMREGIEVIKVPRMGKFIRRDLDGKEY